MKKVPILISASAALGIAVATYFLVRDDKEPIAWRASEAALSQPSPASNEALQSSSQPQTASAAKNAAENNVLATSDVDDTSEDPAKMFKADGNGKLIVSENARLNVEKIYALYTPDEQQQKLAVIQQSLPAGAYRELTDLMERYKTFTVAMKQSYPPGVAPATMEDAMAQHEGLHALRVAHFGAERTEAMYGREERIAKQLFEFMKLEQHQGLTMEEKAEKAQQMLLKSPDLLAAYEANKKAGEQSN